MDILSLSLFPRLLCSLQFSWSVFAICDFDFRLILFSALQTTLPVFCRLPCHAVHNSVKFFFPVLFRLAVNRAHWSIWLFRSFCFVLCALCAVILCEWSISEKCQCKRPLNDCIHAPLYMLHVTTIPFVWLVFHFSLFFFILISFVFCSLFTFLIDFWPLSDDKFEFHRRY